MTDDFRAVAPRHLNDAHVLSQSNRWAATAYIGGYAIECGLKAFFLKWQDAREFSHDIQWLHKAITLLHVDSSYAKYAVQLTPLRPGTLCWSEKLRYKKAHPAFDPKSVSDILEDASAIVCLMQEAMLDGKIA